MNIAQLTEARNVELLEVVTDGLHMTLEKENVGPHDEELVPAEELERVLDAEGTMLADPVRMYLREIGRTRLLRAEEEVALGQAIRDGNVECEKRSLGISYDSSRITAGIEARRTFTEANLRLVVSVAKKFLGRGMSLLDLIQEGNIGLMRAVDKFDSSKGCKFSTYATWWIRQTISRALADQGRAVRIPVHMMVTMSKLAQVSQRLAQQNGREPTSEEIGLELDLPSNKVEQLMMIQQAPVSFQSPIGGDEDNNLGNFIGDEGAETPSDATSTHELQASVEQALESLTERERSVLRHRFGFDDGRERSLAEMSVQFNVTRERIRQIEARALRKLERSSHACKLREFLTA